MTDRHIRPSREELRLLREEAEDLIQHRLGLSPDHARRLVERARTIDQAIAMAELMR